MNVHSTLVPLSTPDPASGELLREDDHEWVVRSQVDGRDALTRIGRRKVNPHAVEAIRAAVLGGPPLDEALPWELRRIFDGYRVRSMLPAGWALPEVLDVGVTAEGLPYVTRAWRDGTPLSRGWPALVRELRDEVLAQVLGLLEQLHARGVVVQDLKPDNTVLDSEARLWLVDLESLRFAPTGAVPCTHYTPRFAAPEQLTGRVSLHASDLYAFGRMVADLTSGLPDARWAGLVASCLADDPRVRPTASQAASGSWLTGTPPPSDATIRVADPADDLDLLSQPSSPTLLPGAIATAEVQETGESSAIQVVEPAPIVVGRPRWAQALGVLAAVAMVTFAVTLALWSRAEVEREGVVRADGERVTTALVQEVKEGLHQHKVVAAKNNEQELSRLLVLSHQAVVLRPDAQTRGLEALATVWAQRWHWKGAKWDLGAFAVSDRLSRAALAAGETPEGVLARGLTAAAACRHAPKTEPVEAWCDEAVARLDRAAGLGPDWLSVEAYWGSVMVYDTRAKRALDRGDTLGAGALANQALDRCTKALPALPAAKVNGPELVEDCAWAAGAARDRVAWFSWTGWQLAHGAVDAGKVSPGLLATIARSAAPECARIEVDPEGWPLDPTGYSGWCDEMTERALLCAGMALDPNDPHPAHRPDWCSR